VTAPTSSTADEAVERLEAAYDASAIQVLEGLEAVRKRPSMYIGSTGERGLHHLVQEVVDNAVDEAMAGHCDRIVVTLLDDGGIRVVDNGRGIPVDEHPVEKLPAVTVALTVLHAGGKFGGGGYKVSGGLHGVGVSVVNALSTRLEVEVKRDGHRWTQSFAYGEPEGSLERHEETDETGTCVTFWASPDIFETTTYSFETLSSRFREMAFLNKGLEIIVKDERPIADEIAEAVADGTAQQEAEGEDSVKPATNGGGLKQRFLYHRGLVDYVEHLNKTKERVQNNIVSFETTDETYGMSLEIALQWTTAYS
jgi:DNA gyrase subunit B